ncbi:hypothetical protein TVAG_125440 [Trichomonas vaginalis G3]|uniref:DUF4704 domain-containing protein n=1 Tax=Trichomonas vaginalis (strain ATCC PRA-98 / G3) TaxID=412133 RepID=A2F9L9_TRIV3|nr:hypothetical protein TVAG_125440 [Trichomonas vaginalis G3]|eukprot:XP_001311330.1 hypothetical protein [Trichomonas vaginalis G3]
MKFLLDGDLYLAILSPEGELTPPTSGLNKSTLESLHIVFPIYNQFELKQISKEMATCHNKLEPITSRFFPLIYQPEIITILTSKSDFILEYYSYISYYILTTYLSWEMNYTPTKNPIYSVPLLESILEICCPKGVVINQKIYTMGISAFYMIFSKIAKQSNFSLFAPFFEPLQVYFISLPELPDESINLLASALEQLTNHSNFQITNDIIPLLNIISKYIYEFPGEISHSILDQIISPLEYQISKLSYEGLNFLSLIANRIPDDVLLRLFALFTNSLTSFISSTKFKFPQPIDEIREDLPTMPVKEATYRVESKKTFLNGIKFQNPPNFPDKLELKTILTKDLFIRLSLIVKSCSHSESVSKLLINNIELILINSKDQPFYLGLTATYLYLCKHLNKYLDRPTMISILLSKPYFDPNITVFDNLKDFESIDTMRYSILELVVKEGFDAINVAIQTWILQPPLFAEIILRINRLLTVEMFNYKTTIQFSKTLMAISLYYQQMNFTTNSPYVETTRKAIFMLITRILEYQELQKLFYNCSIFNTFFFSFIFEEPLRPFILSNFLQFLTTNFANEMIVSSIAQIFDICCSYIDQEDYQIIATSILQVLNDSLIHNSQNVQPFSHFSGPILTSLPRLKVTESSQTLMLNFLHFLTLISNKISSPQVLSLNSTLNRVFADDFPNVLQQKLLQFIAGEPLTSMKPNFIIGQPKILQIYLDFSINKSEDPLKCMQYIYDLLNASMSNIIVCHETNFDVSLLELINKMAGNEEKSELVKLLMDIFCKIAIESSSVNVVHKFVSFMSPINGRYLPNNQELYLKTLNVLLIDELKKPNGYLSYISKGDYLEINGVTGEMINDDFTASCWIFIDNAVAQYKPILFSVVDSRDRRLVLFISGGNLFCTQRNTTEESTGHLEIKLPLMSWIFMTFTYKNNKDGSQVKVTYNLVESKTMDFSLMSLEKGPLKITYGGFVNEPFQTRQNVKICSLSLHSPSIKTAEIQNIYNGGLLYTTFDTNQTLFAYVLKSSGIKLTAIQRYVSKPSISINVNCTETILPQSFASCLTNYCKPEILLPLFAQFDMTFVDMTKMSNLPKLVIECLSNCLFLSNETQEDFHNSNGFSVISHLLNNLSTEHINYHLYTQFFGLLQSLNSQELQFDIISEILLFVPLWMKSDYENHIKILRHWGRVLFPSFKNLIQSRIPIRTFFSMLRLYYFYEQSENIEFNVPRFDSKRENINECRQTILMSLIDMAIDTFCQKDLQLFVSHCLTIVETEQVSDLLEFLEELSKKSPLTIKRIDFDCCSFLFSLIQRNTDNMMRRVISLLITLSQNNILIYPLDSVFQVFLTKLTPNYVNFSLFEYILTKVKFGIHELFPVLVWMSLVLGLNYTKRIFSEVKPFKDFTTHLYWSVWPIISLYHYNDSDLNSMIYEFISKCSINNISVLFCMISIVGHCLNVDSSEMKSNFLTNVAQMMTSDRKLSKADISSFFNVTKFFLFYRSNKEKNKTLQRLYKESDFFTSNDFVITDPNQRLKMKQSMSLNNLSHTFAPQQIPLEKLSKNRSSENLIHNSSPLIFYEDDNQTNPSLLENTFQNKSSGKENQKLELEKVTDNNSNSSKDIQVKILTQNETSSNGKETSPREKYQLQKTRLQLQMENIICSMMIK